MLYTLLFVDGVLGDFLEHEELLLVDNQLNRGVLSMAYLDTAFAIANLLLALRFLVGNLNGCWLHLLLAIVGLADRFRVFSLQSSELRSSLLHPA
jgi:hypothetical protein